MQRRGWRKPHQPRELHVGAVRIGLQLIEKAEIN